MTKIESKAEAEKIKEEFRSHALLWDDHNDEPTKEDHVTRCAIIKVEGIIESNPSSPIPDGYYELLQDRIDYATGHWRSILTELNNM